MRRWAVIVLAIGFVGLVTVGAASLLGVPVTSDIAPEADDDPHLVELGDDQAIWPYYSSSTEDFRQSSAINVVFINATSSDVVGLLGDAADWHETDADEDDAGSAAFSFAEFDLDDPERPFGWGRAVGTERFAYAEVGGEGIWLEEAEQLHNGDYYGTRDHLRLYDIPGEEPAVAIQAHSEHFDWFTLRHTVTSIEEAQSSVESDIMDLLGEEHVIRAYHGNTGVYDSDGWVTVIMAGLPLVVVLAAAKRRTSSAPLVALIDQAQSRIDSSHIATVAAMISLIIGVRVLGVLLERSTDLGVYLIAGSLFPFIGIGIPVAAYLLGRTFIHRMDAALSASIGLATGIILDYAFLSVTVLPLETLLHRGGLVFAVGLLAAGGAAHAEGMETTKRFIVAGALLWTVLVALSLLTII